MALTGATNLQPAAAMATLASNYIDFTAQATAGWAQQYLPDLMEKEAEVFGNRTISGFIEQVGAEEAMASDQVIWSEQGRLHLAYQANVDDANDISIEKTIDGVDVTTTHGIRVGDTVIVSHAGGNTIKAYVSAVGKNAASPTAKVTLKPYQYASLTAAFTADDDVTVLVYGSEYGKGTSGKVGFNEPGFKQYNNSPIIMKDNYSINGSDVSQIGWVEVSGEDGQNGYYWYLKASGDTRARFADYCEMAVIEGELASTDVDGSGGDSAALTAGLKGTEGLFAAIESRGNVSTGVALDNLSAFDNILKEFDKQGAIEEYMIFANRAQSLELDDMLATIGSGYSGSALSHGGGSSYGVFDNDADMALNLGFSGFRRGSYDFYKTDWKYLNDKGTRGGIAEVDVEGVFVPAGVSTVYDQNLGRNLKRPFLHVRYRASQMESRKMKTWTTGSVGAVTSDLDAMEMHFLTERCLVVQGANNFLLQKK
ncbi:MAG: hypothetical protein NZ811_01115, partial [Gammaproteobacteria bacterium]|nr:hypothetical protein [Gammaproteobacteria bacterium]